MLWFIWGCATSVFLTHVAAQAQAVGRLNTVIAEVRYTDGSLTLTTREARGHGVLSRVIARTVLPENWQATSPAVERKMSCLSMWQNTLLVFSWWKHMLSRQSVRR